MPAYEKISEISLSDGVLSGESRRIDNYAKWRTGGIHDDKAVRKAGFKGGVVSAVVLNEQFFPLALHAFGKEWFERGFYSFWYRNPTFDGEMIQAFVKDPGGVKDNVQVEAWCLTPEGKRAADGSIGIGTPSEPTFLRKRFEERHDSGDYRIMKDVRVGDSLGAKTHRFPLFVAQPAPSGSEQSAPTGVKVELEMERQWDRREVTAEPMDWLFGDSPWGRPVAGSVAIARLVRTIHDGVPGSRTMGMVGGIEVRFVNGPLFVDKDYHVDGKIIGVSMSPKTENIWFETSVHDVETGKLVAETLMMRRRLKATNPLYQN